MPIPTPAVPAWPAYDLLRDEDGVTVTGPAAAPGPYPDRAAAVAAVAALAASLRPPRPVRARAVEDGHVYALTVHPDTTVTEAAASRPPARTRRRPARRPRAATPHEPAPTPVRELLADVEPAQPPPVPAAPAAVAAVQAPAAPQPPVRPVPVQPAAPAPVAAVPVAPVQDVAAELARAARTDAAISAQRGPSDPAAIAARTERADLAAALGNLPAAVGLYRDVAERRLYAGEYALADTLADRAHWCWLQMDPATAVREGPSIIRLRAQVPGQADAYAHAVHHLHVLEGL